MKWIREIIIKLILVFVSVLFALFLGELFLRSISYKHYSSLPCSRVRGYYVPDKLIGHDLARNFPKTKLLLEDSYYVDFWTNDLGCFDEDFIKDGREYILEVGDSFSHCSVRYEYSMGRILEKKLGIRVLKCGVSGYGTRAELEKAKKIIREVGYPPKIIILQYYIGNDLKEDFLFPAYTVIGGYLTSQVRVFPRSFTFVRLSYDEIRKKYERFIKGECIFMSERGGKFLMGLKCFLANKSLLYKRLKEPIRDFLFHTPLKHFFKKFMRSPEEKRKVEIDFWYFLLKNAWEKHTRNLLEFKKFASELGSHLIVLIVPTKGQVFSPDSENSKLYNLIMKRLVDFLEKENFDYINLYDAYVRLKHMQGDSPDEFIYWKFDGHWGPLGNSIAADLLYKFIVATRQP